MKKIVLIITFLFVNSQIKAQQNNWITVPLEDMLKVENYARDYTYFKDINHILDKFVGTWVYNQGTEYFKITFIKLENQEMYLDPKQKQDELITRYEYKKNGITVFETYTTNFSKVNFNFINNFNSIDLSYTEPSFTHCRKQKISDLVLTYNLNSSNQPILSWNRIDKPITQRPIPCKGSTTVDISDFLTPVNMVLVKQ